MGTQERYDAVVAEHGHWIGYNLALPDGVFTIGPDLVGVSEQMIQAAMQLLTDTVGDLRGLRILDLGAHEGGYSIAAALLGADVVAVEGRRVNSAKAIFAAEALGLERLTVVETEISPSDLAELGQFDVILCYGFLYHLPAEAAYELCVTMQSMARRLVVIGSAVALRPTRTVMLGGHEYQGRDYLEKQQHRGASIGNESSFFFTRASLLQMLVDVGYTTVTEPVAPLIPGLSMMADSVTLLAFPGRPVEPQFLPAVARAQNERQRERRVPPGLTRAGHPAQGWPWSWRDRIRHEFLQVAFGPRRKL